MIVNPLTGRLIKVGGKTHRKLIKGGIMVPLTKDASGNYTATKEEVAEVDEVPLYDYREGAFHNRDINDYNGREIAPEGYLTDQFIAKRDPTTQILWKLVTTQFLHAHGVPVDTFIGDTIDNGLLAPYFERRYFVNDHKKLVSDIAQHQVGGLLSFVSATKSLNTAVEFFQYKIEQEIKTRGIADNAGLVSDLYDAFDGILYCIQTNRSIDITFKKPLYKKYNRKFAEDTLNLHNYNGTYSETIVPALIKPQEILNVFRLRFDYMRRIFILDTGFSKPIFRKEVESTIRHINFRLESETIGNRYGFESLEAPMQDPEYQKDYDE